MSSCCVLSGNEAQAKLIISYILQFKHLIVGQSLVSESYSSFPVQFELKTKYYNSNIDMYMLTNVQDSSIDFSMIEGYIQIMDKSMVNFL
jgi:hypothetical protein